MPSHPIRRGLFVVVYDQYEVKLDAPQISVRSAYALAGTLNGDLFIYNDAKKMLRTGAKVIREIEVNRQESGRRCGNLFQLSFGMLFLRD